MNRLAKTKTSNAAFGIPFFEPSSRLAEKAKISGVNMEKTLSNDIVSLERAGKIIHIPMSNNATVPAKT
jgi:hypothetical protein